MIVEGVFVKSCWMSLFVCSAVRRSLQVPLTTLQHIARPSRCFLGTSLLWEMHIAYIIYDIQPCNILCCFLRTIMQIALWMCQLTMYPQLTTLQHIAPSTIVFSELHFHANSIFNLSLYLQHAFVYCSSQVNERNVEDVCSTDCLFVRLYRSLLYSFQPKYLGLHFFHLSRILRNYASSKCSALMNKW